MKEKRTLTLNPEAQKALEEVRDHDKRAYMRERAAALLKINAGESAYSVARHGLLKPRDPDTVYAWLNNYETQQLAGLEMQARGKRRLPP